MIMGRLSSVFLSVKLPQNDAVAAKPSSYSTPPPQPTSRKPEAKLSSKSKENAWCVYLIISTNTPIKTYVGVTTSFSRRLKQHNGELKGGAKATRSGRPWICACLIEGFKDQSEASEFEAKWKIFSRKSPRKKKNESTENQVRDCSLLLLQHRQSALRRVEDSFDCSHLEVDWHLSPF
ncbi:structure-specific endonuclease subunit slx1 isoform X1 [Morus notabilis]|uniref:structure-specific endonuclease subunit slx1 isoform X1 n=1 Tax=Morus notabilis TaxID=981085 RepID=UPI000CED5BE0|nr:structure-specific endonuclease subunit slx1 isoform X1 [Morus notabilis]XP_024019557.1 structure-specific endonuclease subunit slx1 isoform X1 [Morus notabilis]